MGFRSLCFVLGTALLVGVPPASFGQSNGACPVTVAPQPPFVPPPQWEPVGSSGGKYFLFGTSGLWAFVHTHWKLHADGRKLPYFSEYFDWMTETPPRMTVLAKRLDAPAPVVQAERVNRAGPSSRYGEQPDLTKPGFMVTALEIPSAGCWEISARYSPPQRDPQMVSYTVLVEP